MNSVLNNNKIISRNSAIKKRSNDFLNINLLNSIRIKYIYLNVSTNIKQIFYRLGIDIKSLPDLLVDNIEQNKENLVPDWSDWRFHLNNRLHLNNKSTEDDFNLLFELVPSAKKNEESLKRIIREGIEFHEGNNGYNERRFYDLSILPLNIVLGEEVVNYFIPPPDYLQPHSTKKSDPYGIIQGKTRSKIDLGGPVPITNTEHMILGSHKFSHTLLFNIDFYCPVGCSDCYKTRMGTREYLAPNSHGSEVRMKIYTHPDLGILNPPTKDQVKNQANSTVKWMNDDPRGQQVRDVIISGGEPLWLPNENIKAILEEFQNATNLKILRICTGAIFLGAPFRVDDVLLDMLKDFTDSTGVRITFQAHLGNYHMISPEAIIAVDKIRRRGISIYSQIPIKNGVNFFLNDPDKTLRDFVELGKRQAIVGVEPYMFIVDMHPSTNAYYVPIEPLMQMWGALVESHDYPGLERPRTLSVLFGGGNIILSGHVLFSAKKVIDKEKDRVIYQIPRVSYQKNWVLKTAEYFEYDEPLMKGINDDPDSLDNLKKKWFNNQFS